MYTNINIDQDSILNDKIKHHIQILFPIKHSENQNFNFTKYYSVGPIQKMN